MGQNLYLIYPFTQFSMISEIQHIGTKTRRHKEKALHNLTSDTILIKLSNKMVRIDRMISKKYSTSPQITP
jgi:hypothetical protein